MPGPSEIEIRPVIDIAEFASRDPRKSPSCTTGNRERRAGR